MNRVPGNNFLSRHRYGVSKLIMAPPTIGAPSTEGNTLIESFLFVPGLNCVGRGLELGRLIAGMVSESGISRMCFIFSATGLLCIGSEKPFELGRLLSFKSANLQTIERITKLDSLLLCIQVYPYSRWWCEMAGHQCFTLVEAERWPHFARSLRNQQ